MPRIEPLTSAVRQFNSKATSCGFLVAAREYVAKRTRTKLTLLKLEHGKLEHGLDRALRRMNGPKMSGPAQRALPPGRDLAAA